MAGCSGSCGSCNQDCAQRDLKATLNKKSSVKKVIGIISGKGGVGKSLVTSLLAARVNKDGFKTAILDADITGPSIPESFGVGDERAQAVEGQRGGRVFAGAVHTYLYTECLWRDAAPENPRRDTGAVVGRDGNPHQPAQG